MGGGDMMHQPRDENGRFIDVEKYVMALMEEKFKGLNDVLIEKQKALNLQAQEYARRLEELNHAHARAQEAQHTFLTIDKYEDQLKSTDEARKVTQEQIDGKFSEIDTNLAEARGAAEQAQKMTIEQGRKSNRNIGIAGIVLAALLAMARWLGVG